MAHMTTLLIDLQFSFRVTSVNVMSSWAFKWHQNAMRDSYTKYNGTYSFEIRSFCCCCCYFEILNKRPDQYFRRIEMDIDCLVGHINLQNTVTQTHHLLCLESCSHQT